MLQEVLSNKCDSTSFNGVFFVFIKVVEMFIDLGNSVLINILSRFISLFLGN